MSRRRRTRVAPLAVGALTAACLGAGCSPLRGSPAGSQCFSAVDCAAGLVCITTGARSVCTADAGIAESELDAGHTVPPPDTGAPAAHDAAADAQDATRTDGSAPQDASHEAQGPGVDGAQPSTDSAAPPVDSGHAATG
jgi:hypothetical protein